MAPAACCAPAHRRYLPDRVAHEFQARYVVARARQNADDGALRCALGCRALLLAAGCGQEAPKAAEKAPRRRHGQNAHGRAQGRSGHGDLRRANAELAGGQHPGARFRLARQARCTSKARWSRPARCCSRWTRSRSRRRSTRPQAALQRKQAALQVATAEPRAHQAARRSRTRCRRRTWTTRPGQCRADRRRGRAGEGAARDGAAQPLVHDDPLAGGRRLELCRRRRRHVPQSAECAAHDRLGADADVDQLQRLRKRDGAHPQRRAQRPAEASRGRQVRRRGRNGRRQSLSLHRRDHVRGSVVQPDDGHVPVARDGQQSGRRAAAQPVRARAPQGGDPAQRGRGSAARRAAEREGPLRLGREQGQPGRAAPGHRRRMEGRRLAHLRRPQQRRQGRRRRRHPPDAVGARSRRRPTCRRRPQPTAKAPRGGTGVSRRLAVQRVHLLRDRAGHARHGRPARHARGDRAYIGIGTQIVVTGYADKTGNAAANVELAKKRADGRARRARAARRRAAGASSSRRRSA